MKHPLQSFQRPQNHRGPANPAFAHCPPESIEMYKTKSNSHQRNSHEKKSPGVGSKCQPVYFVYFWAKSMKIHQKNPTAFKYLLEDSPLPRPGLWRDPLGNEAGQPPHMQNFSTKSIRPCLARAGHEYPSQHS